MRTCVLCTLALILGGCYSTPPVEDFTVRLEGNIRYALIQSGHLRIDGEGLEETVIEGDRVDLSSDLELEPAFAYGATLDLRPTNNAELRLSYIRFDSYSGEADFDQDFAIGGQLFRASSEGETDIAIDRVRLGYAHRVLALGYEMPVSFDWLLRAGLEYNHLDVSLDGEVNTSPADFEPEDFDGRVEESLHVGSPFVGTDLRLGIGERVTVWAEATYGTIVYIDLDYTTFDFATGVRVRLIGPLDIGVFYELGVRSGKYDPDDEPGGEFELLTQGVGLAVGLQF